jgi:5-methylcytosine-specific restriction endonuclease McrA
MAEFFTEAKKMGHHFAIDHAEAEQFGGKDNFENTRPLCSACHYLKTALEFKTKGIRKLLNGNQESPQG